MDSTSLIPWLTFATEGTLTLLQPCPVVTLITRIEACLLKPAQKASTNRPQSAHMTAEIHVGFNLNENNEQLIVSSK